MGPLVSRELKEMLGHRVTLDQMVLLDQRVREVLMVNQDLQVNLEMLDH